jgi:hypothetical protein
MRTTLTIQDTLLRLAKEASVERNCTLGEVIEDALRASLAVRPKAGKTTPIRPLKTFMGTGLQPGVDTTSSARLLDIMEGR